MDLVSAIHHLLLIVIDAKEYKGFLEVNNKLSEMVL